MPLAIIAGELGATFPDERTTAAAERVTVAAARLDFGPVDPGELPAMLDPEWPAAGALVVGGLMFADSRLAGQTSTQIFGAGDVLPLAPDSLAVLPFRSRLSVAEVATLVPLDDRFLGLAHRFGLARRLADAAIDQVRRAAAQQAISQLSRVELRLLAMMWHLAERWGRMTPDGLALDLDVTHARLGQLVGAKRPTVSLALKLLEDERALRRTGNGSWLLAKDSWRMLADDGGGAVVRLIEAPPEAGRPSAAPASARIR
jgi:hypothetical protein